MKVRKLSFVFSMMMLWVMSTSSALAWEATSGDRIGKRGEGPAGELLFAHAEELGLDDATLAKIREVVDRSRGRGEELRFELKEAHRRLNFMLSRDVPDELAIMEQAEAIGTIRIEESKHRLAAMLEIRALLTPDQRAKLAELREAPAGAESHGVLRESCGQDIERSCAETAPGRELVECLRAQLDDLTPKCRQSVEGLRGRRHLRHPERRHAE